MIIESDYNNDNNNNINTNNNNNNLYNNNNSSSIRCKITKAKSPSEKKSEIKYENAAINCPYFNEYKDKMHLLPYFYCKICKIEICDTCAFKHLHNNDISNIVSKDSIIYDKDKILYELIELYERTNTIFKEEEKIILKEKAKFEEINHYIKKR